MSREVFKRIEHYAGRFQSRSRITAPPQRRHLHSPKTAQFYEEQNVLRRYFYIIDLKGQVFQEATKHRNFVSSMKDVPFLNMLHTLLRPNKTGLFEEYPLYFPCGPEHNFIIHEDCRAVLGFSRFVAKDGERLLSFGYSSNFQEFDPASLYCCSETGRFYHKIDRHKYLKGELGLLHPQASEALSSHIALNDDGQFEFRDTNGHCYPIQDFVPSSLGLT